MQTLCLILVTRDSGLILQMPDHPEHVPYHFHHLRVPVYVCGEGEVEVVAAQHVPFPVLTTALCSNIAVTCIGSSSVNGACI